jgi:ribosomal protein L11 methyltransferase
VPESKSHYGEWFEIRVQVDGEAAEAVSEAFNRYGRGGAVVEHRLADGLGAHDRIDKLLVKTYVAAHDTATKAKIERALWHLGQIYPIPDPQFTLIQEKDWAEAWKAHYAVLHIGARTVIVPVWQAYDPTPDEIVIILDPGMAFGTGTHPTTRLCLAALEGAPVQGARVLDLGTGSGVLSIAAAKEGAASVLAVDVDPIAVEAAQENVAANDIGELVQVIEGSLERAQGEYDLVLVNILSKVIVALLEEGLAEAMSPGGWVIASGIIDDEEADVRAAFEARGIAIVERLAERDWVALVGCKAE